MYGLLRYTHDGLMEVQPFHAKKKIDSRRFNLFTRKKNYNSPSSHLVNRMISCGKFSKHRPSHFSSGGRGREEKQGKLGKGEEKTRS